MTAISRGFGGRRRDDVDPSRLPPGHYYERGFPVLSAEPTPRHRSAKHSSRSTDTRSAGLTPLVRRTREAHRRNTRFADADRIQDQLMAHGVTLEDSPTGVRSRPSTR